MLVASVGNYRMDSDVSHSSMLTESLYRGKSMEELLAILNFSDVQEFIEFYGYDEVDVVHRLSHGAVLVLSLIFGVVFILGSSGNMLLILVVACKPSMRSVINIFNVSLAIGDLMIIVFCIPFTLLEQTTEDWILGRLMCKLLNYITTVCVVSSILTMTVIAVERHSAICKPLKSKAIQTPRRAVAWSVVVWCASLVVNTPLFFFIDITRFKHPFQDVTYEFCEWRNVHEERPFSATCVALLYFAPLLLVCVLYTGIIKKLWAPNAVAPQAGQPTDMGVNAWTSIRKKRRATVMLALVVFLYAICWLPYHMFILVRDFRASGIEDNEVTRCLMASFQLLGLSNSCNNPIIYGFMNDKFKTNVLAFIWRSSSKSSSPGVRKKPPQQKQTKTAKWGHCDSTL